MKPPKKKPAKKAVKKRYYQHETTVCGTDMGDLNAKVAEKKADGYEVVGKPFKHPIEANTICQAMGKPFPPTGIYMA